MDNFSITQNGKPLNRSEYIIDIGTKIFSSSVDNLVLDFFNCSGWTFTTGSDCTFNTGGECTFKTGSYCTLNTSSYCTFRTGDRCIFSTDWDCTFNTGGECTFKTGSSCTFETGSSCIFMLWGINSHKFKSYDGMSTILDLDDKKHYVLTKELIDILKVTNG